MAAFQRRATNGRLDLVNGLFLLLSQRILVFWNNLRLFTWNRLLVRRFSLRSFLLRDSARHGGDGRRRQRRRHDGAARRRGVFTHTPAAGTDLRHERGHERSRGDGDGRWLFGKRLGGERGHRLGTNGVLGRCGRKGRRLLGKGLRGKRDVRHVRTNGIVGRRRQNGRRLSMRRFR